MITRDSMLDSLQAGLAIVTFTKKNGETREMVCTLKPGVVPEVFGSVVGGDTMTVWDTEKDAWRSFRIDSVKSFETIR